MAACGVCSKDVPAGAERCPACGFAVATSAPRPSAPAAPRTLRPATTPSTTPSPPSLRPSAPSAPSLRPSAPSAPSLRPAPPSAPKADDQPTLQRVPPKMPAAPEAERLPTMNRAPPPLPTGTFGTQPPRAQGALGPGSRIAGKYEVIESLGVGGMGEVWKARHAGLDSLVAIKVLRADLAKDPANLARIEQEARTASRLKHPNSIEMKDVGTLPEGGLYVVMEYVQGRDLAAVLAKEWPLGEARVCHVVAQVLAALGAAHKAGVVHRDLKAENVMLERIGDDPDFAKVLDFGIATHAGAGEGAREVSGTPQYMSPELATGRAVDHRSDLYAAGVLLYRMVAGVFPFEGKGIAEVLQKQASEAPVPPRRRRPDARCSAELEALILKALEKEPAKRPQSAEEFRKALLAIEERARSPVLRLATEEEARVSPTTPPSGPAAKAAPVAPVSPVGIAPGQEEQLRKAVARARFWRKNRRAFAWLGVLALGYVAWRVGDAQTGGELTRRAVEIRDQGAAIAYDYALEQKQKWDELQRKGPLGDVAPMPGLVVSGPAPAPAPPPAPAPAPAPSVVEKAAAAVATAAKAAAKTVRAESARPPDKGLAAITDPRCPAGMTFVEGATFPWGEKGGPQPVVLVGVGHLCIDRFEYPNQPGAMPKLVGSVGEASSLCAAKGKRLCRDEEWEHACKGPDEQPLPYGRKADPEACNTAGEAGPRELGKAGAFEKCVSGYGAADMVGNAPEWVSAAKEPGAVARRKGGGPAESGNCSRDADGGPDAPAGFRCCADPR